MFKFFKKTQQIKIYAPCNGDVVSLKEVNDPTFSQEMIGKGAAIKPSEEIIKSPIDGKVSMIFPTGHAIGLVSNDGVEVLIHIGLDTVNLQGDGFIVLTKQDEEVKVGTPLIEVDFKKVKNAGYDTIIPVVITNTPNYSSIEYVGDKTVNQGEEMITVTK